jgi:quinoprotein glucose dehydrogenase
MKKIALITAALIIPVAVLGQNDWPYHTRDQAMGFSPLKQITPQNVSKLKVAWTYNFGAGTYKNDAYGMPLDDRWQAQPLMVGGVLYTTTPKYGAAESSTVVALEPETGKLIWKWASPRKIFGHGLAYWPGDRESGARLFFDTTEGFLVALDANSGQLAKNFGADGWLDLTAEFTPMQKSNPKFRGPDLYTSQNPPAIYQNLVITDARPGEAGPPGPPGDIRAWDAHTGKRVWTFHTVPQPGELNHDTWKGETWKDRPGANCWSNMIVDTERGLLIAGLGTTSVDGYRADQPGLNLYGSSLVVIDAATGQLKWYFQVAHHDIWDYDLPTPPVLVDVSRDGKKVPAVVITGKQGLVFILDRLTGKPIYGVEERPVPQSNVSGEETWPTQPFPLKPSKPVSRTTMTRDEIPKFTPEHQAYCEQTWDSVKPVNSGRFTLDGKQWEPGLYFPSRTDVNWLSFPSSIGGPNWGDLSYNPELGYVFINSMDRGGFAMAWKGTRRGGGGGLNGFADPKTGWPCYPPPWGRLAAINVNTGEVAWESTLGITPELEAKGIHTGAWNLGGSIATASGLVFIGATNDQRFRAFDAKTGKELWSLELAASAHATPITYLGRDGKQYVVVAAGGGTHEAKGQPISDTLYGFSLGSDTSTTVSRSY